MLWKLVAVNTVFWNRMGFWMIFLDQIQSVLMIFSIVKNEETICINQPARIYSIIELRLVIFY